MLYPNTHCQSLKYITLHVYTPTILYFLAVPQFINDLQCKSTLDNTERKLCFNLTWTLLPYFAAEDLIEHYNVSVELVTVSSGDTYNAQQKGLHYDVPPVSVCVCVCVRVYIFLCLCVCVCVCVCACMYALTIQVLYVCILACVCVFENGNVRNYAHSQQIIQPNETEFYHCVAHQEADFPTPHSNHKFRFNVRSSIFVL